VDAEDCHEGAELTAKLMRSFNFLSVKNLLIYFAKKIQI